MFNLGYHHDDIINIIKSQIKNNKLIHAWLIYGESGSGKSFLSNEIAKILLNYNLDNNEKSTYINFKCPDSFILMDSMTKNANIITVDEVRKIKNWSYLTRLKSHYKVILIDNVDRMNINANNAFLKILEDPIGDTIILLNSSKISILPSTLKSRCIKIKLRRKNLDEFTKIISATFLSKIDTEINKLYTLCNGDINLAINLIENDHLNFFNQLNNENNYNELLEHMSQLNIENLCDLKTFICIIEYFSLKFINTNINNDQQLDNTFFFNIDKIQNILSNIQHLNKAHSKELILNILRKCLYI